VSAAFDLHHPALPVGKRSLLLTLIALFLAVVTLLPLWPLSGSDYSLYNIQRLAQIVLLCGGALILVLSKNQRRDWITTFSALPETGRLLLILVFGLGVISTLQSALPRYAFLELGLFALLFFLCISIAAQTRLHGTAFTTNLITLVASSIAIYSILFYVNLFLAFSNNTLSPGYSNVRFLAHYLAWTLPLVTLPLFLPAIAGKAVRALVYTTAALWWSIAFFNSAKGLGLGLIVSTMVIATLFRGAVVKKWLLTQLVVICLGLALYLTLDLLTTETGYLTQTARSFGYRFTLWSEALNHIVEHPWLGIGPLHFAHHFNEIAAHPHNSLLQIAAEWGVPAAIFFAALFLWGAGAWIKRRAPDPTPTDIALSFSLLTAAIYSLVSGVVVTPVSQICLAIVCGLMLGIYQATAGPGIRQVSKYASTLLTLALLLILVRFGSVLFPEALHLARDEFVWFATHSQEGRGTLHPRFGNRAGSSGSDLEQALLG
jgi:O-antigen ligase